MTTSSLDVLAIAAHRDDVEQTCGGTLLKMAQRGQRTGILDLTQGEMGTRGTAEDREREASEAAREILLDETPVRLIHGDDVDVVRAQMRQRRAQEGRLDLEMMVGLEFPAIARAHVMQHEDDTDAGKQRPQQMMRAGIIQRFQAGADNGAA